jgi:hypothetical protein
MNNLTQVLTPNKIDVSLLMHRNYGADGCAGAPIVESYYRSGLCFSSEDYPEKDLFAAPTVTCSGNIHIYVYIYVTLGKTLLPLDILLIL